MTKEIWINLPVKDINKSKAFFYALGFPPTTQGNSNDSAGIVIGTKKITVMLFSETVFRGLTGAEVTDAKKSTEVLFSFDAESREEVDTLAKKVVEAGGTLFGKPAENQGWMYGCGFSDLDGHRWNILYMDMSKMPKA